MSKKTNGFEKPNHTQTPNSFFDEIMREIDTMAELKFTLAIIRQTIGWHRKRTRYGVGKIERLTGLARNSVLAGAQAAENRGTVRRIKTIGEAEWELIIDDTPSTAEGANFEGDAAAEGDPPQSLTKNPSTVEGLKRKKEIKERSAAEIFTIYESNIGVLTPMIADTLEDAEKTYPTEWIKDSIALAVENNKRNWRYCETILKRWKENGKDNGRGNGQSKAEPISEYPTL